MTTIGPFKLLELVGAGGMGEVWRSTLHTGICDAKRPVAVKRIAGHLARSPSSQRGFLSEARIAMSLSHSNIVQTFDAGEDAGQLYMVMEWLDGVTLHDLRPHFSTLSRPCRDRCAAYIVAEVCKALVYTHQAAPAIVHRDISPRNIMITRAGEVKLMDFGVAIFSEDATPSCFAGKLRYAAPEQLHGEGNHPRVDLFALGAVFYELLECEPFRTDTDPDTAMDMASRGQHSPRTRTDLPRPLAELLDQLLRVEPSQRLGSAERTLELLQRWPGFADRSRELRRMVRDASPGSSVGDETHRGPGCPIPLEHGTAGDSNADRPIPLEPERRKPRIRSAQRRPSLSLGLRLLIFALVLAGLTEWISGWGERGRVVSAPGLVTAAAPRLPPEERRTLAAVPLTQDASPPEEKALGLRFELREISLVLSKEARGARSRSGASGCKGGR